MSRALRTAATGMVAQQLNIDNISNNLANVNTTGFKRSKAEFQDLLYQTIRTAGTSAAEGAQVPVEIQAWGSTRFSHGVHITFSGGDTATILFHCGGTFDYPKEVYEVTCQGALFRNDAKRGRQGEFSEIHVAGDELRVFHHRYEGKWVRERVSCREGAG